MRTILGNRPWYVGLAAACVAVIVVGGATAQRRTGRQPEAGEFFSTTPAADPSPPINS